MVNSGSWDLEISRDKYVFFNEGYKPKVILVEMAYIGALEYYYDKIMVVQQPKLVC